MKQTPSKQQLNILIVEDETLIQLGFKLAFKPFDVKLTFHTSAEDAWAQPLDPNLDLIITDIGLPQASGIDFARWVRQQPDSPPIVAVSAHTADEIQEDCEAVGIIAIYTKPFWEQSAKGLLEQMQPHFSH